MDFQKIRKLKGLLMTVVLLPLLFAGCQKNILTEMADKEDPEALYFDARRALNKRNYTKAIELFESMDAKFLKRPEVAFNYASAYAGRCGLETISMLENLQGDAGDGFFGLLMSGFPEATSTSYQDCATGEAIIHSVQTDATLRTTDQNMLMLLLGLAKIGVVLSGFADADGDGDVTGWDQCDTTEFPDDAVAEFATGVTNVLLVTAVIGSDIAGDLSDLTDLCDQMAILLGPGNDVCEKTNKEDFSAQELNLFRGVAASGDFGVGSCAGTVLDCDCQ